jgi:hypothetical protein
MPLFIETLPAEIAALPWLAVTDMGVLLDDCAIGLAVAFAVLFMRAILRRFSL